MKTCSWERRARGLFPPRRLALDEALHLSLVLTMFVLVALLLVLVLGLAALLLLKAPQGSTPTSSVRYVRRELLTATERQFYARLRAAVPQHVVAPQVAMSALVDVAPAAPGASVSHAQRGKVSQKRMDFVVLEPASGQALLVVELDDATHDRAAKAASDRERDAILKSVGYRTVRVDARAMPSEQALREQLSPLLGTRTS